MGAMTGAVNPPRGIRVAILIISVPAIDVINEAVTVVVQTTLTVRLSRISPDYGGQIGMIYVDTIVENSDDSTFRISNFIPGSKGINSSQMPLKWG
ncbi:hypothetical protein BMS3Bbin04_01196 [bacterium BMS3Bbin04]|nr:hypothetical protein BMS3Bbin04_01196 [bacterium BMS3Bbin04]